MTFNLRWTTAADEKYKELEKAAEEAAKKRQKRGKSKSSPAEGLFKQIHKTIYLLSQSPRHPSLHTHVYSDLEHPWDPKGKVWEAYAQNKTPGAYRVFWCYGPNKGDLTIVAITPHP